MKWRLCLPMGQSAKWSLQRQSLSFPRLALFSTQRLTKWFWLEKCIIYVSLSTGHHHSKLIIFNGQFLGKQPVLCTEGCWQQLWHCHRVHLHDFRDVRWKSLWLWLWWWCCQCNPDSDQRRTLRCFLLGLKPKRTWPPSTMPPRSEHLLALCAIVSP